MADKAEPHAQNTIHPVAKALPRAKTPKFIGAEDNEALYLHSIRDSKKLSSQEEREMSERIQNGDKRAFNILVTANLKFVVSVCGNYRNRGLPFGDLINEGNLGLIRAAQRFEAGKDCRFISYAVWWIRQGIVTALAEQTGFLKVAQGGINNIYKVTKAGRKLEQKLGRAPLIEEIAESMGLPISKVAEYMSMAQKPVSLNAPGLDDGPGLEEWLEDKHGDRADDKADGFLKAKILESLLASLDKRQSLVLRLHFGVGNDVAIPLSEIASMLDISTERVRQIKESALSTLRRPAYACLTAPLRSW